MSEGAGGSSESGKSKGPGDLKRDTSDVDSSDEEPEGHTIDEDLMRLLGAARRRQHVLEKRHAKMASSAADPSTLSGPFKRLYSGLTNDDESIQMLSLEDTCCTIATATEETLVGFNPNIFVPLLINFISKKHNGNMMLYAVRTLSHLLDMIPAITSLAVSHGAVTLLCGTLKNIEFIDVAEQSMKCLELIAKERPTAVLKANGLSSLLAYIDFFSTNTQRMATSAAALVCKSVRQKYFSEFVKDSLPTLTNLLQYEDSQIAENASLSLSRILDACRSDTDTLNLIVSFGLIENLLRIVGTIGDGNLRNSTSMGANSNHKADRHFLSTQSLSVRSLGLLSKHSASITAAMVEKGIAPILSNALLCQRSDSNTLRWSSADIPDGKKATASGQARLSPGLGSQRRSVPDLSSPSMSSSGQLHELLSLSETLLPPIFEENGESGENGSGVAANRRSSRLKRKSPSEKVVDDGQKKMKVKEAGGEPKKRLEGKPGDAAHYEGIVRSNAQAFIGFAETMVPTLLRVYNSAVNVSVRVQCLTTLHKLLYWTQSAAFANIFSQSEHSSEMSEFVASLLSQADLQIVIVALKMAVLALKKAPSIFRERFLRDGLVSSVQSLSCIKTPRKAKPQVALSSSPSAMPMSPSSRGMSPARAAAHAARYQRMSVEATATSFLRLYQQAEASDPSSAAKSSIKPGFLANGLKRRPSSSASDSVSTVMAKLVDANREILEIIMDPISPVYSSALSPIDSPMDEANGIASLGSKPIRRKHKRAKKSSARTPLMDLESMYKQPLVALKELLLSPESISTHELVSSGMIGGLTKYLTLLRPVSASKSNSVSPTNSEDSFTPLKSVPLSDDLSRNERKLRLRCFVDVFFTLPQTSKSSIQPPIYCLVDRVQAAISSRERFTVHLSEVANNAQKRNHMRIPSFFFRSSHRNSNPETNLAPSLAQLAEPIKLKLTKRSPVVARDPKCSSGSSSGSSNYKNPPGLESNNVTMLIEPLTSLDSLTDFILDRLNERSSFNRLLRRRASKRMQRQRSRKSSEGGNPDDKNAGESVAESEKKKEPGAGAAAKSDKIPNGGGNAPGKTVSPKAGVGSSGGGAKGVSEEVVKSTAEGSQDEPLDESSSKEMSDFMEDSSDESSDEDEDEHVLDTFGGFDEDDSDKEEGNDGLLRKPQPPSRDKTEPVSKENIRFFFQGDTPDPSVSILEMIASRYSKTGREISSTNMWSQTHELEYDVCNPKDRAPEGTDQRTPSSKKDGAAKAPESPGEDEDVSEDQRVTSPFERALSRASFIKMGDASSPKFALATPASSINNAVDLEEPEAITQSLLGLLNVIHIINAHPALGSKKDSGPTPTQFVELIPEMFYNNKLSAKLVSQTQDPLSVCCRCLPQWCTMLTSQYKFLFPFEVRKEHFFAVAFSSQRSLQYMLQKAEEKGQRPSSSERQRLGRVPKIKATMQRKETLKSVPPLLEKSLSMSATVEIEFDGEVGTGEGPTKEFFSLLSMEFQRAKLGLWFGSNGSEKEHVDGIYSPPNGLFPAPFSPKETQETSKERLDLFKTLGKFIAQALMDKRMINMTFCSMFLNALRGEAVSAVPENALNNLQAIDPVLGVQMKRLYETSQEFKHTQSKALTIDGASVDALCLNFTAPGYDSIPLVPGGENIDVTLDNLETYVVAVCQTLVNDTLSKVVPVVLEGIAQGMNTRALEHFNAAELDLLLCGSPARWTRQDLEDFLDYDHGYTASSRPCIILREVLAEMTSQEQEKFLKFVTGSPRLPVQGLSGLYPRLTVVRKDGSSALPSASTCTNYLKLPDYKSKEQLEKKLQVAIDEGQSAFHLS